MSFNSYKTVELQISAAFQVEVRSGRVSRTMSDGWLALAVLDLRLRSRELGLSVAARTSEDIAKGPALFYRS